MRFRDSPVTSWSKKKFRVSQTQCVLEICNLYICIAQTIGLDANLRWSIATGFNCFPTNLIVTRINLSDRLFYYCSKNYSTDTSKKSDESCCEPPPPEKQSIFQRMKQMTKDYWHILIPVHVVTSIGWISIFYTAAKKWVMDLIAFHGMAAVCCRNFINFLAIYWFFCNFFNLFSCYSGVDIVRILEAMNLSERYLDILRGSNAGHWAVAYALYKLFTPIRYTVTVGEWRCC